MILFGIRHKPSGRMMPSISGRGSTALNFHVYGFEAHFAHHKLRREPRLFISPIGARRALLAWLKGEWRQVESGGGGYDGDYNYVYAEPPRKPPVDRKPEDMEIVRFNLSEEKKA